VPICPTCREHYQGDESFCPRDGTALEAAQVDPIVGQILGGRYLIEVRIGEGGMGTVYRARQQSLDRAVAVKLLRRDLAGDDAAIVRFQREARAASSIDHPNCTKVLDFGQTADGLLYLVMELLTGESLGQVLLRGPLPVGRAMAVMRSVALALGHAHDRAIIHRDLKPDNVYLCPGDVVKVLDFGLCKRVSDVEAGVTQAGVVFGTPEYMSPEQAEAKPLDARSDLYSLGAVLFRAITGDLPFHASTYVGLLTQHVSAVPPVPSSVRPGQGITPAVDDLVLRLLAKSPADRPPTAKAVAEELELLIAQANGRGEAAVVAGLGAPGSGRVAGVPQAFGSGRVSGGVPQVVDAGPSGPQGSGGTLPGWAAVVGRSGPQPAAAPAEGLMAAPPGAAISGVRPASTASTLTPAVPRAPRAPIIITVLLIALGGAGLVAWQGGWLHGRPGGHGAAPTDAAATAVTPVTVATPAAGAPAMAAPSVVTPPHSSPTGAKAVPPAKAAPPAAVAAARKAPRETKVAKAPPPDAGVPRVVAVAPTPLPPPPVKVAPPPPPPPPQQDAGVPAAGEQATVALLRARVALIRGDFESALRELEAARRLRENAAVHVGFAEVYTRQGNTLRALAHWQKAVNLSPRDATLRVRFGEALGRAGEVDEACSAARTALALKPQHARALALHGRLGCAER
jgi:hypothetical protein